MIQIDRKEVSACGESFLYSTPEERKKPGVERGERE